MPEYNDETRQYYAEKYKDRSPKEQFLLYQYGGDEAKVAEALRRSEEVAEIAKETETVREHDDILSWIERLAEKYADVIVLPEEGPLRMGLGNECGLKIAMELAGSKAPKGDRVAIMGKVREAMISLSIKYANGEAASDDMLDSLDAA